MTPAQDLTPAQLQAARHVEGPLLVLAGPGSGKTRVITHRIAWMISRGIHPREILAITFTNKAAGEMDRRVRALVPAGSGGVGGGRVWVGTFHKFCARILRERPQAVGLRPNFTIYDTTDQKQLIKEILRDLEFDPAVFSPGKLSAAISRAKNDMQTAEDFARAFSESVGNHQQAVTAEVFPEYQKRLLEANAVDFDDLLLHVVTLLDENPEIREELDGRFRYVLVDEYQDTNLAQYHIVTALSQREPNLCVTGDPDQSIYGWRGARIDNILRFERDFPAAAVVRLEQNFRSTGRILHAAGTLIANNRQRKDKALLTDNPEGEPVRLVRYEDGPAEAEAIAAEIRQLVEGGWGAGERSFADFAVCYRVNALSRRLESAFRKHKIPFQVAAGFAFFDRAEVKDVLAYLRLIYNPDDRVAFQRIVNTPRRGIGKTTLARLTAWAQAERLNLVDAAARADEHPQLSRRATAALKKFATLINDFAAEEPDSLQTLLQAVIDRTGYTEGWRESFLEQDQERLANVHELLSAAREFDEDFGDDATMGGGLEGFLESVSLVSEVDSVVESAERVTLMTLHAAKGLEFPAVYIIGLEQSLIPHQRSLEAGTLRELEEERRLLFVGMTRAEERLQLSLARVREHRGRRLMTTPSDFLFELDLPLDDRAGANALSASNFDDSGYSQAPPETGDRGQETGDRRSAIPTADCRPPAANPPLCTDPVDPETALTTAADLLGGTNNFASLPQGFGVGMRVRHPEYGHGKVTQIGGYARRRTVTVEFDSGHPPKKFIADQSPLEILTTG